MENYTSEDKKELKKGVEIVEMSIGEFIIEVLSRLKESGMTYGQISKAINVNKGTVKKLIDRTWYPRTRKAETKLLADICKSKQEVFQK